MYYLQRGRINELNGNYSEAKGCFDSAIAINPAHVTSLQHLVSKQNKTSFFISDSTCFSKRNYKHFFPKLFELCVSMLPGRHPSQTWRLDHGRKGAQGSHQYRAHGTRDLVSRLSFSFCFSTLITVSKAGKLPLFFFM